MTGALAKGLGVKCTAGKAGVSRRESLGSPRIIIDVVQEDGSRVWAWCYTNSIG